jgi:predicted RNA binding protein YcfA (HicA-like mRNA interferase family)
VKRNELEKELKKRGWELTRRGKKHDIWESGDKQVAVPRHSEINEYTAKAILRYIKGEK